jgi:NTP pyrophosphatase (non-canonical NTP hydrolase)
MDQKLSYEVDGVKPTFATPSDAPYRVYPISLNDYQTAAHRTAGYAHVSAIRAIKMHDPLYLATALAGEVGEACNVVKKIARDDKGEPTSRRLDDLKSELGDVLWYMAELAGQYGMTLSDIAIANLDKLARRSYESNKQFYDTSLGEPHRPLDPRQHCYESLPGESHLPNAKQGS